MNGWATLFGLGGLLFTAGIVGAVLYRGIDLFFRVRPHLRGHFCAAVLWTLVTAFQTAVLLLNRDTANIVGQGVAVLAGSVMVWSWAQFAERQTGMTFRQEKRPLLSRLFVQSFWGVLAVWGMAWVAGEAGNAWLHRAFVSRDIPTIKRLRVAGFACRGLHPSDLLDAVVSQDEQAVRAHLAAGTSPYVFVHNGQYGTSALIYAAVHRNSVPITKMLLDDAPVDPDTSLLQEAVRYGKVEQARFLIGRGADVNEVARKTHFTALQIAKKHGNQPMIALLKGAGAVH